MIQGGDSRMPALLCCPKPAGGCCDIIDTHMLMEDTNSSLLMLARDGWIHHLRRHTVADYLTRGHLNADWMLGESWFRQTLLDHDASVNRANWLWLSACDFSTKQLCMHYSHDTYVRRQSGQKV